MHSFLTTCLSALSNTLPGHCHLCKTSIPSIWSLCSRCFDALPWNNNACQACALPLSTLASTTKIYCERCLTRPYAFRRACAPFRYEGDIAHLIHTYKFHANLRAGHILSTYLLPYLDYCDLLLPVPQHPKRAIERGFDHIRWLGQRLPCRLGRVRRIKYTPSLRGATRRQRARYVDNAFAIETEVAHRHIVILDDVMTTAATVNAMAKQCREAGAHDVQVLTLARTPVAAWQTLMSTTGSAR